MSKRFSKIGQSFSQLGQAFMLPIAILPVAGLLLGLGGALTNDAAVHAYPWLNQMWLQTILKVMNFAGNAVFTNLALIFSIGLAVGLAKGDKGTAGLAGGVAYLVYTATIAGLLQIFSPKNNIDTGVLGAIVIGSVVAYLHNHYRKTQLPQFLGFFGGSRFVPIISSLAAIVIGAIFFIIWPPIQGWLTSAGYAIAKMGSFGSFLYGFLLRLTGAVGLHHTIYPMFWYTALGGTAKVAGKTVVGAQNIFFAQLADPNHHGLFTYGTRFFAGRFATMMFGLPGAALAMYRCLPKRNRKKDGGLYLSGGLTSFLTGITEPIEYTFLFVAPWLYVIHAFLDGCSFYVADIMNIRIGNSFSGGLIDYLLFGVLQGRDKTNWPNVLIMGVIWFFLYFFVFTFCIKKAHINIPGMQDTDDSSADAIMNNGPKTGDKLYDESMDIITALGGVSNIQTVSACATRLRVSLKDNNIVNEGVFKKLGAPGVLKVGGGIQAILGGKADIYSQEINDILTHPDTMPKSTPIPEKVENKTKQTRDHQIVTVNMAAPVNGKFTDLTQVSDEVFSKKMMGEGFAIEPADGNVYSPVAGTIESIFKTKHAIGIKTAEGLEVLLHLGLDTVELEGKPFTMHIKEGDQVTTDTLLATVDLEQIKDVGKDPIVLTLITNTNDYVAEAKNLIESGTQVKAHHNVFEVTTK
ncbi:PTS transporter subunit IIABC [Lactobacillus crispatus]|uniref:PTS transporter subunit IIABC n=1 Tax=Lactobacillus crispatus TaxID=47770 RepID=UPI0003C4EC97|nr:PTS transporter subunit IIABC [Lactobacillus crispatus]EST03165.1 PTS system glucose-specific iia component [Lactobacillus crispatus EM-LC1]